MNLAIFLGHWAAWAWAASWQVMILAALVALVLPLMRGVPARFRYALLMLVFVKLMIAPSLTAPWSLGGVIAPPDKATDSWVALFSDPLRAAHTLDDFDHTVGVTGNPNFWRALGIAETSALTVVSVCFVLWSIGVGITGGSLCWNQHQLSRAVSGGRRVTAGPLLAELERCARELGVAAPRLILLANASGPFLCGFFRPTIVLPAELPGLVERDQLRAILLHELAHYRRGDLLHCWFISVLQCLFWFHPVVWIAAEWLADERELCVDESLVTSRRVEALKYCRTILDVCEFSAGSVNSAVAFLGRGEQGIVERRIQNILHIPHLGPRHTCFLWAMVIVFGAAFIPMGVGHQPAQNPTPDSVTVQQQI